MASNADIKRIVSALRAERKSKGINQKDIAEEIGISQTYLSQIELGKKIKFSTALLLRYANALGSPIPLILWKSIKEEDVPEHKREVFKSLKPSIDELIKTVFS